MTLHGKMGLAVGMALAAAYAIGGISCVGAGRSSQVSLEQVGRAIEGVFVGAFDPDEIATDPAVRLGWRNEQDDGSPS